ncbi:MAG: FG-GAP repeat domain-containing protein [Candidatus Binatia bacterium]
MRMRNVVAGVVAILAIPATALAGSGIFRSAFTEVNASNATGMAVGDFDGDEFQDVVTVNAGATANELNVLIGFGDGTLSAIARIPLNRFPSALLVQDFTGDQIPDAVVALGNDNAVVFLRGRKDQDFFDPPGAPVEVDVGPVGMAATDFDNDGKLDLVVANEVGDSSPGSVSFLRGDGNGNFTLLLQEDPTDPEMSLAGLPAELGTRLVAAGDIDAVAGVEVLALNTRANSISVFAGDGTGFFNPSDTILTGPGPRDFKLVDVNGDGELDLIVAVANADAVTVQLGNGDGTFDAAAVHPVGTAPTLLAVADIDRNGTLDIAAGNSRSADVSLLRGDGMGGFGAARAWVADSEPQALATGDFNDDELLDVVTANQGGDDGPTVAVLSNRGGGTLHGVEDVAAGNGPSAVAVADIDDDAQPDLVVTGDGGVVLLLRSRGEGFAPPLAIDIGGRALAVSAVDLNGDTRPDLAIVDNENSRVAVAIATGPAQFLPLQFYPVAPDPNSITSGDFNADGRADLGVSSIGPPGRASVLLQTPTGTFEAARNTEVDETPIGIAASDMNCDGRDDLVVANSASNTVMILHSNGDGNFTLAQTLPQESVGQGPAAVAVADFNRDGVLDFVVSNTTVPVQSPSIRTFQHEAGACDRPFTVLNTRQAGNVVSALVTRDFTGDQVVDIGLINQTDNVVRVLRGGNNGALTAHRPDVVSRMPIAIAAGDFNSDGRYDAVTANSDVSANNISVLLNCARDGRPNPCDPFNPDQQPPTPSGASALRGDGNNDGIRSAADLVAVAAEVMDGDGDQVEAITRGSFGDGGGPSWPNPAARVSPGVDANGDGVVNAQDRRAVARRIFGGA